MVRYTTAALIAAFVLATMPVEGHDGSSTAQNSLPAPQFIRKGHVFSEQERERCLQTSQSTRQRVSSQTGGAENNTGVIVLAVIGALVLVGAVIYAADKNNKKDE